MYDELVSFFQKKLLELKNEEGDLYDLGRYDMIEEIYVFLKELKENNK